MFPASIQKALPSSSSDRIPIALDCNCYFPRSSIFRFEAWWFLEPELEGIVVNNRRRIRNFENLVAAWVQNLLVGFGIGSSRKS